MINKKTIVRMIILSMLLYALAGCGKKEDEFDDYALFLDEEKPVEGDAAAKDETDSQAYEKNILIKYLAIYYSRFPFACKDFLLFFRSGG